MSRLSDLTYLTRAVFICWTFIWFLQHVWNIDRFEALKWGRVKKHDLKSAITVLLVIMCPLQAFYDITTSIIKYQEGFIVNPLNGEIVEKPSELYSEGNEKWIVPTDYILCANFSLQTCLLFLLQSFWNYLAKNLAKSSFMGSFEFKSYIIYAIFSVFIFPFLQYFFRHDPLYTELIPQLAYSIFMFLIALFGLRSHKRFTNLLILTRKSSASQINIILKLEYFRDMNRYLTWSLFIGSISFLILCIDGLTPEKYLNSHKFSADLLMCHINFSLWLVFVTLMLIFYPSTNTVSDTVTLAKAATFSNGKRSIKDDLLEPPTPQWLRSRNVDESQWSSQVSTQHSNSHVDNNTCTVDLYEEVLPPPPVIMSYERKSTSLDIPLTPPSPYRPYTSIPQPLPPPPSSSSSSIITNTTKTKTSPTTKLTITTSPQQKMTPISSYSTQSPTSPIKQLNKVEKLKYPSSPIISRNNSFDNFNYVNDNSYLINSIPNYPQQSSANVPIISPLPIKNFTGSTLESSDRSTLPKKSSRRPSIASDDTAPVIRITTSTNSLRSMNSITLPSSDEDDKEPSTINRITNLDTRKVAPFMYQNGPEEQEMKTTLTEEKQESPSKQQQSSSSSNKNNSNNAIPPSTKTSPVSKSSPISDTSQPPLTSKTKITTKPYQSSPLGRNGSRIEITNPASTSTSTVKKSSPAQINNLKNPKVKSKNGSVNGSTDGAASSVKNSPVRNSIISIRSRSNSTASVGSGKVISDSEKKSGINSVKNSVNNMRNSIIGRSNSAASVGAKSSVIGRIRSERTSSGVGIKKTVGRDRSSSSASISSISSTSSTSSASSSSGSPSSSRNIKKVIKTGVGKVKRNSRVS
ncbi:hypothetical protein RclHR1_01620015 [Rhizophagus clarus]|nr:hypothetical protein RclHR1_01620015 [Rhizophagus clarus]